MQYLNIKTVDGGEIKISKFIFGAAGVSRVAKEQGNEAAFALIDRYRELGGNIIDTARFYGNGTSEQTVCDYMKARKADGPVYILTKGGFPDLRQVCRHFKLSYLSGLHGQLGTENFRIRFL